MTIKAGCRMRMQRHKTTVLTTAVACAVLLGGIVYWQAALWCEQDLLDAPVVWDAPSALAALGAGNVRFVASSRTLSVDTAHDTEFRRLTAMKQHPFTAILCCSDSRVCPELIFDQRVGCIFEIRNAGNVVDEDVLASFEYAVEHLHVPLVLVLAHKGCGAIQAVYESGTEPLHDHLHELQKHMQGIHQQAMENHAKPTTQLMNRLCKENAIQQARSLLRDSQIIKLAVEKREMRLICGVYDMETGVVEVFEP